MSFYGSLTDGTVECWQLQKYVPLAIKKLEKKECEPLLEDGMFSSYFLAKEQIAEVLSVPSSFILETRPRQSFVNGTEVVKNVTKYSVNTQPKPFIFK